VAPHHLEQAPHLVRTKIIKAMVVVVEPGMGEVVRASLPVNSLPRDVADLETRVNSHTTSAVVEVLEIAAAAAVALVTTAAVARTAALETAEVVTVVASKGMTTVEMAAALGIVLR